LSQANPGAYKGQFDYCYQDFKEPRTFEAALGLLESDLSHMDIQTFEFAGVARMTVSNAGRDFEARMHTEEDRLLTQDIQVIQVWLNTASPVWGEWESLL
jgi:hypothetical protein